MRNSETPTSPAAAVDGRGPAATRPAKAPAIWQSLDEQYEPMYPAAGRTDEFPADAPVWPPGLNRRRFLEVMGASLALAGATGCGRQPQQQIVPYVTPPEEAIPGKPLYFATAMPWQGYARGVLAESHLGRPTKLEGNPDHPDSLGATDAMTQAAILELYDPDRSRAPLLDGAPASWERFEREWLERWRALSADNGAGLALLTEPTTSPTLLRGVHRLLDRFPGARWYQHTALPRFDRDGVQTDFDPAAVDVILAVADDFLHAHPASLRYARAFAARRRMTAESPSLNRLYMIEPTPTVTGTMADHRLPAAPARIAIVLHALAAELGAAGLAAPAEGELAEREREFVRHAARDLRAPGRRAVCLAGPEMNDAVHQLVAAINSRLGADGARTRPPPRPSVRSDADPRAAGTLRELATALEAGDVQTLLILGSNPVYTAPADVNFAAALAQAGFTVHMRPYRDETAERCHWHLPESHFLEAWSDLRAYNGLASIAQPLIEPLFDTRTLAQVVHFCAHPPGQSDLDLVRSTWRELRASGTFDADWQTWLRAGVIPDSAPAAENAAAAPAARTPPVPESPAGELGTILVRPDPNLLDGRWANNAWLQELPRPLSHLVWDNAALVSPAFARRHQLHNGDVVTLQSGDRQVDAPVWVQPGQADACVTVHLGYGRARAGSVGTGIGFNAYRLRTHDSPSQLPLTGLTRTGRRHELVSTQGHFQMEGRDLVRVVEAEHAQEPHLHSEGDARHLFPAWESPNYAWAMVIDLSTCIGCNACTVACQAENNIPVVGKEQVAVGREMHWIRVDRYYAGAPDDPRILHQPVPCMHCETAPCELVCPVYATVHSSEGLNDMVYNRCIGTRYCSNNCPYKVRRFNFLDYQLPRDALPALQLNPNVTVRNRGVMEKCTYCVQRINSARIEASKEQRRIRDGELQTACQQVCPTEAIIFGDINAAGSEVAGLREHPLNYELLPELNTRPRTSYLARVINPAAEEGGAG